MSELLHLSATTGWHKSLNRTTISRVARSDHLIDRVMVSGDGRLKVRGVGWDDYWASDCMRGLVPDGQSLIASSARTRLLGGTTFRQTSLSDYYRGLHLASERSSKTQKNDDSLLFPLRRFNLDVLVLPDGCSILDQL